jgi:hypothetical protein
MKIFGAAKVQKKLIFQPPDVSHIPEDPLLAGK